MYALNYTSYTRDGLENWNRSEAVGENTTLADCESWIYEQDTFVSTIISRVRSLFFFFISSSCYSFSNVLLQIIIMSLTSVSASDVVIWDMADEFKLSYLAKGCAK